MDQKSLIGAIEKAVMNEWPELRPIEGDLPPVEPFTPELLPAAFRPMVQDAAERMSVPLDFPGIVSILLLAGVVSRRATITPKANDTSWVVTPNLWGGLIARPGEMKSPLIDAVCAPVEAIQAAWQREYEEEMESYKPIAEEHELRLTAYKQMFIAHIKDPEKPEPVRPGDPPIKPILKRIVVNDSTHEKLHVILSENPAGVLVCRDELTGWLADLDKPGREGARAFFLEAWAGNSSFTVDRIERGTINAYICVSLLGGIQPARLRNYLFDAITDGPNDDGLIQRLQLLVWPGGVPWKGVDRLPDQAAATRVEHAFRKIVEIDPERPLRFTFSSDAQELFNTWRDELEVRLRVPGELPALIAHLSKYRSLMPSLALLFEMADRSSSSINFEVSLEHAAQAAAFCDYLESHARRVYSCIVSKSANAAFQLASKIRDGSLGRTFTARDVYRREWRGLVGAELVKQAIETLVDDGWLRLAPGTTLYQINPAVFDE
jgi:hypothetical protein